jgi:hypothetical protein
MSILTAEKKMKVTLISAYVLLGLFTAQHYAAWRQWCQVPQPFLGYVVAGVIWPLCITIMFFDDVTSPDSFKCPPGPYYVSRR